MQRKGKKQKLHIKAVAMIYPVTRLFKVVQYDDKRARYPRPIEIMYDQGKEFIGHEFRKSLIET